MIILIALLGEADIYKWLIVAGLIFCLGGDVFLMLPSRYFTMGLGSFLAGHWFYIAAFTADAGVTYSWSLLPLLLFGDVIYWLLHPHLGNMRGPVIAYLITILAMAWQALGRWSVTGGREALWAALGVGLRLSELAALKLTDLEISERRGTLYVRSGKGVKQREIPLNKQTRAALSAYLEQREQIEVDDLDEEARQRVFFGQRGPLTERGLDQLVAKYAYQARLESCTAHTLRHSFAKNLVDAGTPLDQVATLLGHESLATTRVYTRPSRQDRGG